MNIRKIIPPKGWKCKINIKKCEVNGRNIPKSYYAHAHNSNYKTNIEDFGLICLSNLKYLGKYEKIRYKDGSYTLKVTRAGHYLKHEYAHILTPNKGHCKEWLINLEKLGGSISGYINKNGQVRGWKR